MMIWVVGCLAVACMAWMDTGHARYDLCFEKNGVQQACFDAVPTERVGESGYLRGTQCLPTVCGDRIRAHLIGDGVPGEWSDLYVIEHDVDFNDDGVVGGPDYLLMAQKIQDEGFDPDLWLALGRHMGETIRLHQTGVRSFEVYDR